METFYVSHENQSCEELCLELEILRKYEGEFVEDFILRFKLICFRFHLDDKPSAQYLFQQFLYFCCLPCIHRQKKYDEIEDHFFHNMDVTEAIEVDSFEFTDNIENFDQSPKLECDDGQF